MQKIALTAREALRFLNITPDRFLRLQDLGKLPIEMIDGGVFYNLQGLRELDKLLIKQGAIPGSGYTDVSGAINILRICRKTFYSKVNRGEIQLHKEGRLSLIHI